MPVHCRSSFTVKMHAALPPPPPLLYKIIVISLSLDKPQTLPRKLKKIKDKKKHIRLAGGPNFAH